MRPRHTPWRGAGLGLRREMITDLRAGLPPGLDFVEVAPENWAGVGGPQARFLQELSSQLPVVLHGLCLNLGGFAPLDTSLIRDIGHLMKRLRSPFYSEHLAWTADDGNLFDLLPLPFTEEAARHVAQRVATVQDMLGCRIGIENVSTYAASTLNEMSELDFTLRVRELADCDLHLDVNNVHVNSVNHGFDAHEFIRKLPSQHIRYIHIAGHLQEPDGLLVDTHGADVIDPVWALLDYTYAQHGIPPTLLERDFNLPALDVLMQEVARIGHSQSRHTAAPRPLVEPA